MTKGNPYKVLDDLLTVIPKNQYLDDVEIINKLYGLDINYDMAYFEPALDKLHKDGYLLRAEYEEERADKIKIIYKYKLSFEALLLINDGGYAKFIERNTSKEMEIFDIQKKQKKYNKSIRDLTYWIAFGTVVAGLYTLFQISDWLHYHDYLYYDIFQSTWKPF